VKRQIHPPESRASSNYRVAGGNTRSRRRARHAGGLPSRPDHHERTDRAGGRRLQQPLLVLWSTHDDLEDLYGDPLVIWRDWSDDVTGHGIASGHHMAELAPDDLTSALAQFLA
jgi:hypothetical protein